MRGWERKECKQGSLDSTWFFYVQSTPLKLSLLNPSWFLQLTKIHFNPICIFLPCKIILLIKDRKDEPNSLKPNIKNSDLSFSEQQPRNKMTTTTTTNKNKKTQIIKQHKKNPMQTETIDASSDPHTRVSNTVSTNNDKSDRKCGAGWAAGAFLEMKRSKWPKPGPTSVPVAKWPVCSMTAVFKVLEIGSLA